MKISLWILLVLIQFNGRSQIVVYQDLFRGGVQATGYSPSATDVTFSGIFDTEPIPASSSIKQVFLFASRVGILNPINLTFNGDNYLLDSSNVVVDGFISQIYGGESGIHLIDVSNSFNLLQTIHPISSLTQQQTPNNRFTDFFLIILYDDDNLNSISFTIALNDKNFMPVINYQIDELNYIDLTFDVGLCLSSGYICDDTNDGEVAYVDGSLIGSFGGNNPNSGNCGGPHGSFKFENNIFQGMNSCNPTINFNGYDVIKNIASEITNPTSLNLDYETSNPNNFSNSIWINTLAYTSPCDTFSVSTPSDTTICHGDQLQLNVTGGQAYEWLPATGLSCANCPNPVFTADSSMFYTVRIWNNDSCSVVRPLKINVRPKLEWGTITTTPSECGSNAGTVTLNALLNNGIVDTWTEVGGVTQTNNIFQNLSAGNHTFFFTDTNGCQSADTTILVGSVNSIIASFSVSPQSGAVPLTVTINNTSQNATNYEWFLDGVSQGSSFTSTAFGVSGNYEIMLVAWNNNPLCADTAWQTVIVYDSLIVTVPNVFTPNHDNINEFLTLTANQDVNYELIILNRWGNEILTDNGSLFAGTTKNVWDGGVSPDGVYFVKLRIVPPIGEVIKIEDFVTVVRN